MTFFEKIDEKRNSKIQFWKDKTNETNEIKYWLMQWFVDDFVYCLNENLKSIKWRLNKNEENVDSLIKIKIGENWIEIKWWNSFIWWSIQLFIKKWIDIKYNDEGLKMICFSIKSICFEKKEQQLSNK